MPRRRKTDGRPVNGPSPWIDAKSSDTNNFAGAGAGVCCLACRGTAFAAGVQRRREALLERISRKEDVCSKEGEKTMKCQCRKC